MEAESRSFPISRGVKQGDPISGLLFVAVLQVCIGNLKKRWERANKRRSGYGFGIRVGDGERLTNLRFADDILLVASSKSDIKKMMCKLQDEALKFGLQMHCGKTKVLTNTATSDGDKIAVNGRDIDVLSQKASEKYLGRRLCMGEPHQAELRLSLIHISEPTRPY